MSNVQREQRSRFFGPLLFNLSLVGAVSSTLVLATLGLHSSFASEDGAVPAGDEQALVDPAAPMPAPMPVPVGEDPGEVPVVEVPAVPVLPQKSCPNVFAMMRKTMVKGIDNVWWVPGFESAAQLLVEDSKKNGQSMDAAAKQYGCDVVEMVKGSPSYWRGACNDALALGRDALHLPWSVWTDYCPAIVADAKKARGGSEDRALKITGAYLKATAVGALVPTVVAPLGVTVAVLWVPGAAVWRVLQYSAITGTFTVVETVKLSKFLYYNARFGAAATTTVGATAFVGTFGGCVSANDNSDSQ